VQLVLAGVLTLAIDWWAYPVLWLLPLATVTAFCNSLRAFVEHASPENEVAPESRLFDVAIGPLERLMISPCHFNYHALHHAFPSVPHYRLPRAKEVVAEANGGYPFVVVPGYLRVLFGHLRRLRSQEKHS
jgi:fatty acid desaturase